MSAGDLSLRLAVFDCDGTLLDGQHTVIAAMRAAFADHGLSAPADQAVRQVIGLRLEEGIAHLLGASSAHDPHDLAEAYRRAYRALRERQGAVDPMYDGIAGTLDRLDAAGVLLAVATGKSRRGLIAALAAHRIERRFVSLQTSDTGPGKPHPAMLLRALSEAGVAPGAAVMIGDTTFDMAMARSAGVAAIGVAWGYHAVAELQSAGADVIAGAPAVLAELVLDRLGAGAPCHD